MSIRFSDTTNFKGLVQLYERECDFERGYVSGNTNRLRQFAADANVAWDDYVYLALKASGKWQWDDSNQNDFPIIKTNLVDGQRDYTFTTDEDGNFILDIYKVMVQSETSSLFQEVYPVDQQERETWDDIAAEQTTEGMPFRYDKTANGIFLDPIPGYNKTNGLKVYINREASYFVNTDTTKTPGCPGIHHKFFYLKPALEYARRNGLASYQRLREEVVSLEGDEEKGVVGAIERYFSRRSRDERAIIRPKITPYI